MKLLNCFGATFVATGKKCSAKLISDNEVRRARDWARGYFTAEQGKYIIAAVFIDGWNPKGDALVKYNNLSKYNHINHWVTVPRVSSSESPQLVATWGLKTERAHALREIWRIEFSNKSAPIQT